MARIVLLIVFAMVVVTTLIGCGTLTNCLGADKTGPRAEQGFGFIYGGVYYECLAAKSLFAEKSEPGGSRDVPSWVDKVVAAAMLVVDMPLTAVADTLTLPYTIRYTLQCWQEAREQASGHVAPASDPVGQKEPAAESGLSLPTHSAK